jgi:hypothetical protein
MLMSTGFSRPGGDFPGDFAPPAGEAAGPPAQTAAPETAGSERPYPPSWIDRVTDGVRRLPLPAWVFYLALGLGLSLLYLALLLPFVGEAPGALPLDTVVFYSFLNGMTPAYLLGLIHYLDNSAAAALAQFRPVLTVDAAGYNRLRYHLTTLPAWPTLLAAALGVVYTFVTLLINFFAGQSPGPGAGSPIVIGLVVGFNALIYVLVAVLVFHTLYQLRMVNVIYTQHTRINLFQLGPLYALSGLTARTAVGIGIPTYAWFQANISTTPGSSLPNILQTVFLVIVITLTFIWPLLGAHRLLEQEKQQLQDEVARRIEAALAALHSRADSGDLADYAALKGVLDGLLTEQGVIDRLRTWPWRTETVRGLSAAFLLPILIWVVQRVLERLGI